MIRPENSEDEAMNGKLLVTGMLVSLVGIAIFESLLVRGLSPMP